MMQSFRSLLRASSGLLARPNITSSFQGITTRDFSSIFQRFSSPGATISPTETWRNAIFSPLPLMENNVSNSFVIPVRHAHSTRHEGIGFIHMDFKTGKKKPEPNVLARFYRLHWGGWIKRIAGSQKRVWKMQRRVRRKKDYHVFVGRTWAKKLDIMVTKEYREEKFYVDDIYEPYQRRNNLTHLYYMPKQERVHRMLECPELNQELMEQRRKEAAALLAANPVK